MLAAGSGAPIHEHVADLALMGEVRRLAEEVRDGYEHIDVLANNAGALFAMGLIDELNHALVARYRQEIDPTVLAEAVRWFAAQAEPAKLEELLLKFTDEFPNVAVYRGETTAAEWLKGATENKGSWWPDYTEWLRKHSGQTRVASQSLGSKVHKPIADAPGSYVLAR